MFFLVVVSLPLVYIIPLNSKRPLYGINSFTSMPLGRIIYVPGASSALTNQPNVNYKWKNFTFSFLFGTSRWWWLWWWVPCGHTHKKKGDGTNGMAFIMQNFCVIDWHEWTFSDIYVAQLYAVIFHLLRFSSTITAKTSFHSWMTDEYETFELEKVCNRKNTIHPSCLTPKHTHPERFLSEELDEQTI